MMSGIAGYLVIGGFLLAMLTPAMGAGMEQQANTSPELPPVDDDDPYTADDETCDTEESVAEKGSRPRDHLFAIGGSNDSSSTGGSRTTIALNLYTTIHAAVNVSPYGNPQFITTSAPLPNVARDPMIAPFWVDTPSCLSPPCVLYITTGIASSHAFVVKHCRAPPISSLPSKLTRFEVQFRCSFNTIALPNDLTIHNCRSPPYGTVEISSQARNEAGQAVGLAAWSHTPS